MPSKRKPKPEPEPILNADPLMSRGVIVTHPEKHITPGNASIVWLIVMMAIIGGVGAICTTIWWQKEDLTAQIEAPYVQDNSRFLTRFIRGMGARTSVSQPIGDRWGAIATLGNVSMPYPNGWHVYSFHDLFSQRLGMNPLPIVEGYESFMPTAAIAFTSTFDPNVLKAGFDAFIQQEQVLLQNARIESVENVNGLIVRKLSGDWLPASEELSKDNPFYYANQSKTIYFITDNAQAPTYMITARVTPHYVESSGAGAGWYEISTSNEEILSELVKVMGPTSSIKTTAYSKIEDWSAYTEITNMAEKTLMTRCFKDENDGSPDALNAEIAKLEAGKMYSLTLPGDYRLVYTPRGSFPIESFLHAECGETGSMSVAFHYEDKILWKAGCGGVLPDKNDDPVAYQRVVDCQQSENFVTAQFPWY